MTSLTKTTISNLSAIYLEESFSCSIISKDDMLSLQTVLANSGFTLDDVAFSLISKMPKDKFNTLCWDIIATTNDLSGDIAYDANPLFINFPKHTLTNALNILDKPFEFLYFFQDLFDSNTSEFTLLTNGQLVFLDKAKEDRLPLNQRTPLKVISICSKEKMELLFENIIQSPIPISDTKMNDLTFLYPYFTKSFLPKIIQREISAKICSLLLKDRRFTADTTMDMVSPLVTTPTDVLRIALFFSNQSSLLKENLPFSLTTGEKKIVLKLLGFINHPEEDLKRYKNHWLKLFQHIQIRDKRWSKFSKAQALAYRLRNHASSIQTFNSKIEFLLKNKLDFELANLLASRPGDMARRIDNTLRKSDNPHLILGYFKGSISGMTTNILFQLKKHFSLREESLKYRHFIPKGAVAKIMVGNDDRKTIPAELIKIICDSINSELLTRFSDQAPLDLVFIDPALKNHVLSFSQRNTTKTTKTLERGSRVKLSSNEPIARIYCWWRETESSGRIDVDLSAVRFDSDWSYAGQVSWTSYHHTDVAQSFIYSGDLTEAPSGGPGAVEFIDINLSMVKKQFPTTRYIVMNLNSYCSVNYSEFECQAGIMMRNDSGEPFEASTVEHKFDVNNKSLSFSTFALDLETMELIWLDVAIGHDYGHQIVERQIFSKGGMKEICEIISDFRNTKTSVYDFLEINTLARGGTIASSIDESFSGTIYDSNFAFEFCNHPDLLS